MADKRQKFHRKAQTLRVGIAQKRSGELWGRGAYDGATSVLAYLDELPDREEGTEFVTDVPYNYNGHPVWAYWYLPANGGDKAVREVYENFETYAVIDITVTKSRYRCKA